MKILIQRAAVVSLLLSLAALGLEAQQNAKLSGTVMDQTGKGIPNATIELRSAATQTRSVTSDAEGKFSASDVTPGSYTIVVAAPGFALATRSGAQVNAGSTLDIPITLSVEALAAEVICHLEHPSLRGCRCEATGTTLVVRS